MCRAHADEDRARGLDAVRPRERERKAGQRRAAPADRRPAGVWAERALDWAGHAGREKRGGFVELGEAASRPPVEEQVGRCRICVLDGLLPAGAQERGSRDEDRSSRARARGVTRERDLLDACEALVERGRLQLSQGAHLGGRGEHSRLLACQLLQLLGRREKRGSVEQSFDEVDLRLRERRVEPDAPSGDAVSTGCLDHSAPRGTCEVGVVEDDAPSPRRERLLERIGQIAQRPSAFVPVEADMALVAVLLGDAALPGSRDAHDEYDVTAGGPMRSRAGRRTCDAEASGDGVPFGGVEDQRRGACRRACRLRAPCAGDRDHIRRDGEHPGEGDLGRSRTVSARDLLERVVPRQAARAARATERRVRDHGDPFLDAPVDDASPESVVVERAEGHLDGRDRGELERLVKLAAIEVRDADIAHDVFRCEAGERTQRGTPRRARVRSMDQVEVDLQAVECGEARLAVGADGLRATVGQPAAAGPGHPALRDDPSARVRAAATESSCQQGLVVAELFGVQPVGARGVEDGDPRSGGGRNGLEGALLVAVLVGREAHAAEADAELRRGRPATATQDAKPTPPAVDARRRSQLSGEVHARGMRVLMVTFVLALAGTLAVDLEPGASPRAAARPTVTASIKTVVAQRVVEVAFVRDGRLRWVERIVPKGVSPARHALRQLLRGPTRQERARGLRSGFQPGKVRLRFAYSTGDLWLVRYSRSLTAPAAAATVRTRLAQIGATLTRLQGPQRFAVIAAEGRLVTTLGLGAPADAWRPERGEKEYLYSVRGLQLRLATLGYLDRSDVSGSLDYVTSQALLAFQGWEGLGRTGTVTDGTQVRLFRSTRPKPVTHRPGRRIEIHRDLGVLLMLDGNEVERAVHTSTGAGGVTPVGRFRVYRKELYSWSVPFRVWMPFAAYFVGGIATHEYPDVPAYPASHGCVRLPDGEAHRVYEFVEVGTPVQVF